MRLSVGLALYVIIWWTMLFTVLPFAGVRQGESGTVVPGTPESAPVRPRLLRIFLINTVVATVVFAVVWLVIASGWVRFEASGSPVR